VIFIGKVKKKRKLFKYITFVSSGRTGSFRFMNMKGIIVLLVLVVLVSSMVMAFPDYITINHNQFKNNNIKSDALYYPLDRILINGYVYEEPTDPMYGQINEDKYRANLVHEVTHALCLKLFNDIDANHTRCFTKEYNEGYSSY